MFKKLSSIPLNVYIALKGLAFDLKNDTRGISGVVVAVLLILVAVLAIVLIWYFLGDWLLALWNQIMGDAESGLQPVH